MLRAAAGGRITVSGFMSPDEQYRAASYLKKDAEDCFFVFFGGYADAERKRLFIFPLFYAGDEKYAGDFTAAAIQAVNIRGSGYERLTHRSFMGAVLATGVERDTIGDIIVRDEYDAIVLCDEKIAGYLISELKFVSHDKVKTELITLPDNFNAERRYVYINGTVASARLDSVVASLTGLSREKAKNAIISGFVYLNYTVNNDCDSIICENDIISVRGCGKYKIGDISQRTKKNRLRLSALKYI